MWDIAAATPLRGLGLPAELPAPGGGITAWLAAITDGQDSRLAAPSLR